MPRTAQIAQTRAEPIDYYEIAVRRFKQQTLPNGQATTVWSYGSVNHSGRRVRKLRRFIFVDGSAEKVSSA